MDIIEELIKKCFHWVIKNKEWLFSGVGIAIASFVIRLIVSIKRNERNERLWQGNNEQRLLNDQSSFIADKSAENLNKLTNPTDSVVDRFIDVYINHGILVNQIPNVIDSRFGLKISDFKSKDSILNVLTMIY